MGAESIAIVGPTASGKTRRAVAVAKKISGEIISADSRQVYRGMSIGTGKDISDYDNVSYHLIDIADAGDKYNLHRYLKDFRIAYDDIIRHQHVPVICGGSGMYVENAVKGICLPDVPVNPDFRESLENKSLEQLTAILAGYKSLHNTTDVDTVKRAIRAIEIQEYYKNHPEEAAMTVYSTAEPLNCVVVGVDIPRVDRRRRISERLIARLDEGMVNEVRTLLDSGIAPDDLIYYGLEYKYLTLYLIGKLSYDEMVHDLEIAIHQFAKRQMTWFRGMEARGTKINWLPYDMPDDDFVAEVLRLAEEFKDTE